MSSFTKPFAAIALAMFVVAPLPLLAQDDGGDAGAQAEQAKPARSYESRLKEARRPFEFIQIDYMDVHEGQEEDYLKVEAVWKKIHDAMAARGKIVGWGVAKARENDFGYEYITWKLIRSRGELDSMYNWDAIEKKMGSENYNALMQKTGATRTIVGSELLALDDYTVDEFTSTEEDFDPSQLSFGFDFMTPAEGRAAEYVAMEQDVFQPRHQHAANNDARSMGWRMFRKLMSTGETNPAPYRTVNLFRRDIPEKSPEEWQKVMADAPEFPADLSFEKVDEIRKWEPVVFDVVYHTEPTASAERKAWEELVGAWTHTREDGSYRVKIISPYQEILKQYNADGELLGTNTSPMSIRVKDGIKHFSAHHGNGTYHGIYDVHDGKWYEQLRGIFHNVPGKPDGFLVYEKGDRSEENADSSATEAAASEVDGQASVEADNEESQVVSDSTSSTPVRDRLRGFGNRLRSR